MAEDDAPSNFQVHFMDTDDIFLIEDPNLSLIMQVGREYLPSKLEVAELLHILASRRIPSSEAYTLQVLIERMGITEQLRQDPAIVARELSDYLTVFPDTKRRAFDYLGCRGFVATCEGDAASFTMNNPCYKVLMPIVGGKLKDMDKLSEDDLKAVCYASGLSMDGDYVIDLLIPTAYLVLNDANIKKLPPSEHIAIVFDGAIEVIGDIYANWSAQYTVPESKKTLARKELLQPLFKMPVQKTMRGRA